jgi:hypothetical protein
VLLKSKDKLVLTSSATSVIAKVIRILSYKEEVLQKFTFEVQVCEEGTLAWVCLEDQSRVNPELVARDYLSAFLIKGANAYHPQGKS